MAAIVVSFLPHRSKSLRVATKVAGVIKPGGTISPGGSKLCWMDRGMSGSQCEG